VQYHISMCHIVSVYACAHIENIVCLEHVEPTIIGIDRYGLISARFYFIITLIQDARAVDLP